MQRIKDGRSQSAVTRVTRNVPLTFVLVKYSLWSIDYGILFNPAGVCHSANIYHLYNYTK